jgi:hypothetical protein
VVETVLTFEDFRHADEVFLTGNLNKVTPVTVDGIRRHPLPARPVVAKRRARSTGTGPIAARREGCRSGASRFPRGSLLATRIACRFVDAPWIGLDVYTIASSPTRPSRRLPRPGRERTHLPCGNFSWFSTTRANA